MYVICIHMHIYLYSLAGEILKIVDEELGSRPYIIQQGIQVICVCGYIHDMLYIYRYD